MKRTRIFSAGFAAFAVILLCAAQLQATLYPGNGNSNFGGALGQGSITLTDDGTTISGVFTRGPGNHNNTVVIYIDSKSGGFSTTSGFTDTADGLRRAVSGLDGGNRSTYDFASGFLADYGIALHNNEFTFGNNFELVNGGGHTSIGTVNLSGGGNSAASYTFEFDYSEIGMGSPTSFNFVATYISNTAFSSNEAVGSLTGTSGWGGTQTFSNFLTYTSSTIPEPGAFLFGGVAATLAAAFALKRRIGLRPVSKSSDVF